MKKLLLILAVAGFAVACNNDAEKTEEKKDSTTVTEPTTPTDTTTAPVDTTKSDTTRM